MPHSFGWKPPHWGRLIGEPVYSPPRRLLRAAPSAIDLRPNMPAVFDQGRLGSCTANAIAGAIWYDEHVEQVPGAAAPSRLFLYYNSRLIEGTTSSDSGATIADAVKSAVLYGYIPETEDPYDISTFTTPPTQGMYADAVKVTDYAAVMQTAGDVKAALAAGHPVPFGFHVPQQYENVGADGIMQMPTAGFMPLGGHANLLCGYDDAMSANGMTGYFLSRNSWGTSWGLGGYVWMPYAFVLGGAASDFWGISTVPSPAPGPLPPPVPPQPIPPGPAPPGHRLQGFHVNRPLPNNYPLGLRTKGQYGVGNYGIYTE